MKKNLILILKIILTFAIPIIIQAKSGGPDIVGNGAGRIEQLTYFHYRNLDKTISFCLNTTRCSSSNEERQLLLNIRQIILDTRTEKDRLIFLPESEFQKILNPDLDPAIRIAKTDFHLNSSIYFNLNELYKIPDNELSSNLVAILIHELGHQTGERSHAKLDAIGNKVSLFFELTKTEILLDVLNAPFKLSVFSNRGVYDFPELLLQYREQTFEAPSFIQKLNCLKDTTLVGIQLSNIHWEKVDYIDDHFVLRAKVWSESYCEFKTQKVITSVRHSITFEWHYKVDFQPGDQFFFNLIKSQSLIEQF
ncbi:MAG: hypothetical protein L6Q33_09660 [Bacteriovoracaceae bacterium]|nr:hypothetical protein [Bacteriovoracaceae bacterium]